MSALVITYAVTDDNFNGTPWVPDGPASDFWAIVARSDGRTKWRRITAASNTRVTLAANGAHLPPGGTNKEIRK